MKAMRSVLVFGAVAALAICIAAQADAGGKKKKKGKKGKVAAGVIVKVEIKDNAGSITIKTGAKKKKGKVISEGKEISYKISADTKVSKREGKGKKAKTVACTCADLKEGLRVVVRANADGAAETVTIFQAGKKKKKKGAE